ncbi:LOW QUALITY PROTEIN: conserved hypothetical protein, partial [Streptomyces sp. SPB78]
MRERVRQRARGPCARRRHARVRAPARRGALAHGDPRRARRRWATSRCGSARSRTYGPSRTSSTSAASARPTTGGSPGGRATTRSC